MSVGSISVSSVPPLATRFEVERVEMIAAVNFDESDANSRPVPGAVIVGVYCSPASVRSSAGTPREEKLARPPSFVPAATEMTHGALA